MKKNILLIILFVILIVWQNGFSQQVATPQIKKMVKIDSLLDTYSIEEILKFREYYQQQLEEVEQEKESIREKGIEDAENFIANNPDSKVLDKVLMRLAELYYEKANEKYLEEMQQYDQMIEQLDNAVVDSNVTEPVKDFSKPLAIYERIIHDFPHSNLVDDACYNKGYVLEEIGEIDSALHVYQYIITEFPESRYVPESLMRIAEYHFTPPRNDIEKAIGYYKRILEYKDSPKYDEALYRLGWCYYRLSDYPQAVSYFTLLVNDVERLKEIHLGGDVSNPDLRDEALEYIGLSFLDQGGLASAVEYIQSIGNPAYGFDILKKMGDVYMNEKEEYREAIAVYSKILKMYPEKEDAPQIHEKIVNCYRFLGDDRLAYLSRDQLFNQYKPGNPWWMKHEDEAVRDKIYQVTERALRDNITLLFQKAEIGNDVGLYQLAVNDCKKYLKVFPADSSAPQVHWNMALTMDTKLKQYDQAFEEYMKICDLYWNSKYQRYAAENAIALGKDAVELDTTTKVIKVTKNATPDLNKIKGEVLSAFRYDPIELTSSEKKLIRAYNNYIKLFPHEPQTVKILNNAGAMYFNNNLFKEALRYFNTIVKHFPDYERIHTIKHHILESYFGKGDYRSAEIIARRLKNDPKTPPELAEKAKRRLAESIFLSAKVYADSNDHLQAGNEFVRVVREVPTVDFADLSLFNAACEYDRAKEFSRAVETYNYLIETRVNSRFLLDAMNNLAIDYGELYEYKNAALTYEQLANTTKDTSQIHDALYNSSLFFAKAEEWENAIRINTQFVKRFPDSEDADDMFYDIATYYLKLDKFDEANRIFGEYAEKFPTSPRVVETFYRRGKYFEDKEDFDKALEEYNKAVAKNEEFKQKEMDTNDYFAAEALSRATKIKFNRFQDIEFTLPLAKMEQQRKQKRDLLIEIVDGFTKVASYSTIHLYEATYNIGKAYEEFADTWYRQELPPMDLTRRIVTRKEINEIAVELYERAEDSYKQSVRILRKLADNYEKSLIESDSSKISRSELKKIVSRDSTLHIARRWIERSEERLSKVIYDMAELHLVTINDLLNAPIPEGLSDVALMEYNKQVLNRAVEPLVRKAIEEHIRNIREAWDMGVENNWVKVSRRKVITTNNLLAHEYQKLAQQAIDLYFATLEDYEQIIDQANPASEMSDPVEVADEMAALIDFSREFALNMVDYYKQTLNIAIEEKIQDPCVLLTEEDLFREVYHFAQKSDTLARVAYLNKKKYEKLYRRTNQPTHEDALFAFEDNYFSIKENNKELLELAYQLSQDMNISNRWTKRVLLTLVELSPEEYCSTIGLSTNSEQYVTDNSWVVSPYYREGWVENGFDDRDWKSPEFVNIENRSDSVFIWSSKIDTVGFDYDTTYVTVVDSSDYILKLDSLVLNLGPIDSSKTDSTVETKKIVIKKTPRLAKIRCDRVYFRKHFLVTGLPVAAEIRLKADDSYNIFLNGEYISTFKAEKKSDSKQEHLHILTDGLKSGENVLAIEGIDSDKSRGGLSAFLKISSLPEWEQKKQQILFETSDKKVKENLAMDKYIIVY